MTRSRKRERLKNRVAGRTTIPSASSARLNPKRQTPRPPVGVIIGYGGLPEALRRAAFSIVPDRAGLLVVSGSNQSARDLDRRLSKAVARYPGRPILIFADMYGTSCGQAGSRLQRNRERVATVFGVSLPLLVRFLQYRHTMNLEELVQLMTRTASQQASRTIVRNLPY